MDSATPSPELVEAEVQRRSTMRPALTAAHVAPPRRRRPVLKNALLHDAPLERAVDRPRQEHHRHIARRIELRRRHDLESEHVLVELAPLHLRRDEKLLGIGGEAGEQRRADGRCVEPRAVARVGDGRDPSPDATAPRSCLALRLDRRDLGIDLLAWQRRDRRRPARRS